LNTLKNVNKHFKFKRSLYSKSYSVVDHTYDVVIVGSGSAGMRTALGLSEKGYNVACLSKTFTTRNQSCVSGDGINAALGNMHKDDWHWHMYDTVKGSDWLGDQNAIHYMTREAEDAVLELEKYGVPFSRLKDGRILQRTLGGSTLNYGKGGNAKRSAVVADRIGHSIVQTLYGQCLKNKTLFFDDFYVLDVIMEDEKCKGVIALNMNDGSFHRFQCNATVLATGGFGQAYSVTTAGQGTSGDGLAMVSRLGLPLQDMEFVQFHPLGLYPYGQLVSEAGLSVGGKLINGNNEAFMEYYSPIAKEFSPRDVLSRAVAIELSEGRGYRQPNHDINYILLRLTDLSKSRLKREVPTTYRLAKEMQDMELDRQSMRVIPSAHVTLGGIPTTIAGQVINQKNGQDSIVDGLYAVGGCASVSVHGANALSGNTLLANIVFARSIVNNILDNIPIDNGINTMSSNAGAESIMNLEKIRFNEGSIPLVQLRNIIRNVMHKHAGIFRNEASLRQGIQMMEEAYRAFNDINIADSSIIWNSNLIEAMELKSMISCSLQTLHSALNRRESRGCHARSDFQDRNDKDYLKHTLTWMEVQEDGSTQVSLGERPVVMTTIDEKDCSPVPLDERKY
jgi:succinate dehydrogenase (ubiquinone) flavoprotein subunit